MKQGTKYKVRVILNLQVNLSASFYEDFFGQTRQLSNRFEYQCRNGRALKQVR